MKKIKPLKSKIKTDSSEILPEETQGLINMPSDIIVKKLEANIKLRETPINKRKLTLR